MAKPKHIYLISAARKVWYWGPERRAAIKAAMRGPDMVECAMCGCLVPFKLKVKKRKLFAVDHIEPIVPVGKRSPSLDVATLCSNTQSWDDYLWRMMYGALQVLCLPCHKLKTKAESIERKQKR